jgi:hypothetical protein
VPLFIQSNVPPVNLGALYESGGALVVVVEENMVLPDAKPLYEVGGMSL